jgi:streptomycin 6-kinase
MTAQIQYGNLPDRLHHYARAWRLEVEDVFETETSAIAFVSRGGHALVLKVVKRPCDEWHSGEVLAAFEGSGFVRAYEHAPGAVLLERLRPGNSLVEMALNERDEEATSILADIMQQMAARAPSISQRELPNACATVHDWAEAFARYLVTGDEQVPKVLVEAGQNVYLDLCASQRQPRLLHGDLQHYNVLFDSDRGWLAIDPKGVVGEIEYEIGAALRNPIERPELFLARSTIERRLRQFTDRLAIDYERTLQWAFAQAVLSAIWGVEDGFAVDSANPGLRLAEVLRPMLGAR